MNPKERGFTNPRCLLRSAILLLTVYTTYVTCQNTCVSGTCLGNDASCLATVNTTCPLYAGGSCLTTITSGRVDASCSNSSCPSSTTAAATTAAATTAAPEATTAAGAETTSASAPTTTAIPTEASTDASTAATVLVERKRRADTSSTSCCEGHMCNAYKSSAVRINVSLAMLAGVIWLAGNF